VVVWRRIRADGCEWEVRVVADESNGRAEPGARREILEFRALDGLRPPRRLALPAGAAARMDDAALRAAYRRARPIGAELYGRPGKRMADA